MISRGVSRMMAVDTDNVHRYEDWYPTSDVLGAVQTTSAGVSVTSTTALTLSSYFAAIRNVSEDLGKIPIILYRRLKPRGRERATKHPLYPILHDEPNDDMGAMTFIETLNAHAMNDGAGYAEIEFENNRPAKLWPIHPSRVQVKRDDAGELVYDIQVEDIKNGVVKYGEVVRYPQWAILHIHGLGAYGTNGYAMSSLAREAIGLGIASQKYSSRFFSNNATPMTVIMYPAKMKGDAIKNFRQKWDEQVGGENTHKPALLQEGMKIETISISPEDSQLIESGYFSVEDMARWFRIPPHKIGHLLRSTFSNITEQNLEYVIDCLDSWATRWQQEITRKLLMADERSEYYVEFLFDKLLRGDPEKRSRIHRNYFNVGVMSQDDIREKENMNPLPDGQGENYWRPLNMEKLSAPDPEPTGNGTGFENTEPSREPNQEPTTSAIKRVLKIEERGLARIANKEDRRKFLESKRDLFVETLTPVIADSVALDDYATDRITDRIRGIYDGLPIGEIARRETEALLEVINNG